MATSDEHFARYGSLRARLLAQHFAYSRHQRVNFVSLWNWLLDPPPGLGTNAVEEDELKRWNVIVHGRENPLAYSAQLVAFLSVEHALGHDKARPIVDLALDAIGELYKFDGDFAGYPTRWEARTSAQDEGVTPLDRVRDFLVDADGEYLYSIPATDPRHVPFRSPATLRALKTKHQAEDYEQRRHRYNERYRSSELSMDEVAGLVGAYAIAVRLVDVPGTRSKIRAQVSKLGDYLADHGYLLVRPAGGFTARGATGALPAYEYPIVNAFADIAGTDFAARVDFLGALDKASYLAMLRDPILRFQIGGTAALVTGIPQAAVAGALGLVQGIAGILGIPVTGPLALGGAQLAALLNQIATMVGIENVFRALALYVHRDCFDVWDDNAASEVALASVFDQIPPSQRVALWTGALSVGLAGFSVFHLPPLALSAVDGTDTVVGDLYSSVVAAWRARPPTDRLFVEVSQSPFTSALALLHATGRTDAEREAEEAKLVGLLDAAYDALSTDLPLEVDTEEGELHWFERTNVVDPSSSRHVLNYLAGLALAWLYEKRRRDAGTPVQTDRFPVAPGPARFAQWPAPTVPGYVVNRLEHVQRAVRVLPPAPGPVPDDEPIDLFSTRVATAGALTLHPILPTPTANFLGEVQVTVREADRDIYTGIDLQDNDEFAISATGQIRGAPLAGLSGPDGWAQLADDPGWPLHAGLDRAAHKFALLGSLGGYFAVGSNFPRTRFLHSEPLPLYLRINDSAPGDGSGDFVVTIKLWGQSRPIWRPGTEVNCVLREPGSRRITGLGGDTPDGSTWRLPLDQAIKFIDGGHVFRVGQATVAVRQTSCGQPYLRTTQNKRRSDNLSNLPACRA